MLSICVLAAILSIFSCQVLEPEVLTKEETIVTTSAGTPATVGLAISIAPEQAGTAAAQGAWPAADAPATRAVDDPANPADIRIRNLCVLQYAGTTADAPLIGKAHYLSDDEGPLDLDHIPLAGSGGAVHTLVVLANTFTRIPPSETLGEMVARWRTVYSEADVEGHTGAGITDPDGIDSFQRLGGLAVTEVTDGQSIQLLLHRSTARLRIRITNAGAADGLSIREVQLCNVSQRDPYLIDYTYIDPADGTAKALFPAAEAAPMMRANPIIIDFAPHPWTGAADGTGSAEYCWYVPENCRGFDPSCVSPDDKNHSPLAFGATYLLVKATYGTAHAPVEYRFYLGANLKDDFNLRSNTAYTYDLRFDGKGRLGEDSRISDWAETVDFDVDANCYILNPSPVADRTFTFNAIHRPNIFWGERYGLNEQFPNYIIDRTKQWKAILLWTDFEMTQEEANAFLVTKEGTGDGDYDSPSQRIRIVVPAGHVPGNAVVGIYLDDPSNILWSWHLWITDYRPDEIGNRSPMSGHHLYPVTGGEIHRYEGAAWQAGGRYENGYAMDRNLGARTLRSGIGNGCYYQWGRKDAFPGKNAIWRYDAQGVPDERPANKPVDGINLGLNYADLTVYRVNHPVTLTAVSNLDHPFRGHPWNDPEPDKKAEHEESGRTAGKSFFDPCPPGWAVPYGQCYSFHGGSSSYYNQASATDDFIRGAEYFNGYRRGNGRTYYPGGFLANKDKPDAETVFFSYNDVWQSTLIPMGYGEYNRGLYWCNDFTILQIDYWSISQFITSFSNSQPAGIRCVKE